jgi:hypothetical protein
MEISFEGPHAQTPSALDRLLRSAFVVAAAGFLVVRAGLGSVAGPGSGAAFETRPVVVAAAVAHPMFSVPALAPGQSVTRDATIAVSGPSSDVRLFADASRTRLARSLVVTVTRGTVRGGSFAPDEGAGTIGGVLYHGPLASFPASWTDGIRLRSTRAGEASSTFRFRVWLPERFSTQGAVAVASFVWEARER